MCGVGTAMVCAAQAMCTPSFFREQRGSVSAHGHVGKAEARRKGESRGVEVEVEHARCSGGAGVACGGQAHASCVVAGRLDVAVDSLVGDSY